MYLNLQHSLLHMLLLSLSSLYLLSLYVLFKEISESERGRERDKKLSELFSKCEVFSKLHF